MRACVRACVRASVRACVHTCAHLSVCMYVAASSVSVNQSEDGLRGVPFCFYTDDVGYQLTNEEQLDYGWSGDLILVSGNSPYGKPLSKLKIVVYYIDENVLRFKVSLPRYAFPVFTQFRGNISANFQKFVSGTSKYYLYIYIYFLFITMIHNIHISVGSAAIIIKSSFNNSLLHVPAHDLCVMHHTHTCTSGSH